MLCLFKNVISERWISNLIILFFFLFENKLIMMQYKTIYVNLPFSLHAAIAYEWQQLLPVRAEDDVCIQGCPNSFTFELAEVNLHAFKL